MNEVFILEEEFNLNGSVHEITGISIEHKYDLNGSACEGEFIISGDYREHEVSVNRNDFSFHIPFSTELRSNINLDSVEVEINDFTYELDGNLLKVHVEYTVNGEQATIEFAEEADLEEFLNSNNVEIVDLSIDASREEELTEIKMPLEEEFIQTEGIQIENDKTIPEETFFESQVNEVTDTIEEKMVSPRMQIQENNKFIPEETFFDSRINELTEIIEEKKDSPKMPVQENVIDKDDLISSINSEESYVTYNVHVVTPADTFETISNQYNINVSELKRINNIEEIITGMKLIIPNEED